MDWAVIVCELDGMCNGGLTGLCKIIQSRLDCVKHSICNTFLLIHVTFVAYLLLWVSGEQSGLLVD